jgi:hypothetical protein
VLAGAVDVAEKHTTGGDLPTEKKLAPLKGRSKATTNFNFTPVDLMVRCTFEAIDPE